MIRTALLAAAFAFTSASALAQSAPAKPAAKKTAKAAAKALPAADADQLQAAQYAHVGPYDCEFKQSIDVVAHPTTPGYVNVKFGKAVFTMKPVLSSTGALRLEDVAGRTLLLQIANKSMLMDTKAGRRLVDNCVHEKQRTVAQATTQ